MGVALLAWGRFFGLHGERVTVPAPVDGRGAPWLLDFLAIAIVLSALPPRRAVFHRRNLPCP